MAGVASNVERRSGRGWSGTIEVLLGDAGGVADARERVGRLIRSADAVTTDGTRILIACDHLAGPAVVAVLARRLGEALAGGAPEHAAVVVHRVERARP